MRDVSETWVLRPDDDRALLTINVSYGMRLGPAGKLLDLLPVKFLVTREIRAGIVGLKRYIERRHVKTPSNHQPALPAGKLPLHRD